MSDTLRERCEKLAQKWEGYAKAEAFVPHGFEAQSRKTFGAAASELREALAVPEPAASHSAETEARLLIQDLAMLVRRLIRRVHKFDVSDGVAEQARQFVERKGLHGSVTRPCQDNFGTKAEVPEPAASETDLERSRAYIRRLRDELAEKDREADALIELALRMMDAYHMSGEIGVADLPTVTSVREAAKKEGGA